MPKLFSSITVTETVIRLVCCKEQPPAPQDFVAVWRLKDGGNGAATVGRQVHAGMLSSGAYGE